MANRLTGNERGATFVEFTAVFPFLMLLLLGAVDVGMLMVDWAGLNRATYAGARFAAVSAPVATGINAKITGTLNGQSCIDPVTGAATASCTARSATTCVATGSPTGGSCPGYTFNDAAMNAIRDEMNKLMILGTLDRRQISVTYTPTTIGYVGRSDGFPVNITVGIRCFKHKFYFIEALMGWAFPAAGSECNGVPMTSGIPVPPFATTMPSEDLTTN